MCNLITGSDRRNCQLWTGHRPADADQEETFITDTRV